MGGCHLAVRALRERIPAEKTKVPGHELHVPLLSELVRRVVEGFRTVGGDRHAFHRGGVPLRPLRHLPENPRPSAPRPTMVADTSPRRLRSRCSHHVRMSPLPMTMDRLALIPPTRSQLAWVYRCSFVLPWMTTAAAPAFSTPRRARTRASRTISSNRIFTANEEERRRRCRARVARVFGL